MLKNIFISFFLLSFLSNLGAQELKNLIICVSVNDATNTPVKDVNVLDSANNIGASTNQLGICYLKSNPKITKEIRLSYVGFRTIRKRISKTEFNDAINDTLFLKFTLYKKSLEIATVDINATTTSLAYTKRNVSIIDYDFYKDNLLLLLFDAKGYMLKLVDKNSNTISELIIRDNPTNLFRDCHNQLHLQYADSSYLVRILNATIYLDQKHERSNFDRIALPCIASTREMLFLLNYGLDNKVLSYSLLKKGTKDKQIFHEIVDMPMLIGNQDYRYWEIAVLKEKAKGHFTLGESTPHAQRLLRTVEANEYYLEEVLKNPSYHPLFKVNNSILIFNHLIDSVFIYSSLGEHRQSFAISHHKTPGWDEEIIKDYRQDDLYGRYEKKDFTYLKKIEIPEDEIGKSIKIEKHVFPEKVRINDGFAYYLYRDINQVGALKKIYRQRLD